MGHMSILACVWETYAGGWLGHPQNELFQLCKILCCASRAFLRHFTTIPSIPDFRIRMAMIRHYLQKTALPSHLPRLQASWRFLQYLDRNAGGVMICSWGRFQVSSDVPLSDTISDRIVCLIWGVCFHQFQKPSLIQKHSDRIVCFLIFRVSVFTNSEWAKPDSKSMVTNYEGVKWSATNGPRKRVSATQCSWLVFWQSFCTCSHGKMRKSYERKNRKIYSNPSHWNSCHRIVGQTWYCWILKGPMIIEASFLNNRVLSFPGSKAFQCRPNSSACNGESVGWCGNFETCV